MIADKQKTFQSVLTSNTRYLRRWLNILCNTEEYYNEFVKDFMDEADLEYSMFEFRDYLKHTGRGQDITIGQLKSSIDKKNGKQLKALLEESLLIPVDNAEIVKVLKIRGYAELAEFIREIKAYSNSRYVKVIDEYFYYNEAE